MKGLELNIDQMLTGAITRARHVFRFAGTPVNHRENIAEHSFYVTLYALLLGEEYIQQWGGTINRGALMMRAMVHDLEENLTGDVVRSVKYAGDQSIKDALHKIGNSVMLRMSEDTGAPVLHDYWRCAKDATLEGRIVALADLITVAAYAIQEKRSGNNNMHEVLACNKEYLLIFLQEMPPDCPAHDFFRAVVNHVLATMRDHAEWRA